MDFSNRQTDRLSFYYSFAFVLFLTPTHRFTPAAAASAQGKVQENTTPWNNIRKTTITTKCVANKNKTESAK